MIKNIKSLINCLDHIALTVSDLKRTKTFYQKIFGMPDWFDADSIMYKIGKTKLFICLPYGKMRKGDRFDPNRIGLEHIAFGVSSIRRLSAIATCLDKNSIQHSGIHIDKHSKKEKIWLNDPDGIRLEFFM